MKEHENADLEKLIDTPVDVYRNLHKGGWSIRSKGIVCAHAQVVMLHEVHFVVQPAGRKRAQESNQRNVHAFARGTLMVATDRPFEKRAYNFRLATYHYASEKPHFFYKDDSSALLDAELIVLADDQIYVLEF